LVVRGIREANDLDLVVSDDLWDQLLKEHNHVSDDDTETKEINKIILSEHIKAWGKFGDDFLANVQISTADEIYGVKYVNLDIIKKIKSVYSRSVDLKDIKLIEKYQKK